MTHTGVRGVAGRMIDELFYVKAAVRAGLLAPIAPQRLPSAAMGLYRFGALGGLIAVGAVRFGDRAVMIDERGSYSYARLDKDSNAVANAWREAGIQPGAGIAILARNHRGFLVAVAAAAKLGARLILLNTDFAGPQLREVAEREGTELLVHDEEYTELLDGLTPRFGSYLAWTDSRGPRTLDALAARSSAAPPPRAGVEPKLILLTSGTTGTPKGAARKEPRSLAPVGVMLERIPFRSKEVTSIPAPLFHTLGFAHAMLAIGLGSTIVTRRRFRPEETLLDAAEHGSTAIIAVPVMLQRMVDTDPAFRERLDLTALRIFFVAGSQLGSDLCQRAMAAFGPVVYNLYGSTEVAYATIAGPADLAVEPGCVGIPLRGTTVRLYDDAGNPAAPGQPGRIFVGNGIQFEGYTGGGGKEVIDGLMSSGDVGHFDAAGRLFIDGRDDDMIVSGGENLFPGEIEELLAAHPAIREVSVIGVPDEKYGQRLAAFVVLHEAGSLTEDEVKKHVGANLARFKTPREVRFLDELPRNPTGKVLKRSLRGLMAAS